MGIETTVKTVPARQLFRKHNLEFYMTELLIPRLRFLDVLDPVQNETGEFTSVVESANPLTDLADGSLSEPVPATELAELTMIKFEPKQAISGNTIVFGYKFEYTDQQANRSQFDSDVNRAIQYAATGLAYTFNTYVANALAEAAAVDAPADLTDWGDPGTRQPRADLLKIRKAFNEATGGVFVPDRVYLEADPFYALQDYIISVEGSRNVIERTPQEEEVDLDGLRIYNVQNTMENANFLVLSGNMKPGILEKYTNPEYAALTGKEVYGIPDGLINVNQFKEDGAPHRNIVELWMEIGVNVREPKSIMAGTIST